jgi:hypothetical protein
LRVDGGDARAAVPAAKVEVEVAVENLERMLEGSWGWRGKSEELHDMRYERGEHILHKLEH